jgi:dihydroxyacid dehydratase/phosphogluconate dehydratase
VALLTDGRFSGATRDAHGRPRDAKRRRGPIAFVEDGDLVTFDMTNGRSMSTSMRPRWPPDARWVAPVSRFATGVLAKNTRVSPASEGAVTG